MQIMMEAIMDGLVDAYDWTIRGTGTTATRNVDANTRFEMPNSAAPPNEYRGLGYATTQHRVKMAPAVGSRWGGIVEKGLIRRQVLTGNCGYD